MPPNIQTLAMAVPRDPTVTEIAHFLSTRNGAEMMQIVQAMRAPAAQASLTATLLHLPSADMTKPAPPEKAKKALNAFVGYRCFYIFIPVLKQWPMKKLSNLMGVMWEADPNKSLWSLMTKAWSAIRDQIGKDKAPLDMFFRIICPYLNIPTVDDYLEHCGWTLKVDAEGTPSLSKGASPAPEAVTAGIANMALSVEDIIKYCQSMGYAQEYVFDFETQSPTFLAQSYNNKGNAVKSQTQLAGPSFESRLAARNKRRAKRQTTRETGTASLLRKQIANVHITHNTEVAHQDDSVLDHGEPVQFYDDFADLLTNHMGQVQQDNFGEPVDLFAAGDQAMTGWTDWGAFRLGADEDATLPSFDFATL